MRRQKEKALVQFRAAEMDKCLCGVVLKLKWDKLKADYALLAERVKVAKAEGKDFHAILGKLLRAGVRLKVIKDVIREIQITEIIVKNMVMVEINGSPVPRLSEKDDYRRSCRGKVGTDEQDARSAAAEMCERTAEAFEAYKCRHCDDWHVGHAVLRLVARKSA